MSVVSSGRASSLLRDSRAFPLSSTAPLAPAGAESNAWSLTISPMPVGCVVVTEMPSFLRHEAYDCASATSFGSPLSACALALLRSAVAVPRSWADAEP